MTASAKSRAIGLNHIALEVGDIEEALAFYGRTAGHHPSIADDCRREGLQGRRASV